MPQLSHPYWYRIAPLRPRLRSHVEVRRHQYRGKRWYVLQDHTRYRQHRVSSAAYAFLGLMNGSLTVQEMYQAAEANLGDQAPTQNDVVQLLAQLHTGELMQCDVPADLAELLLRQERECRTERQSRFLNPLSTKFPLFDPERIMTPLLPLVRPLLCRGALILWLAVVGTAASQAAIHWSELTLTVADRILTPQNIAVLWLLFPLIKILHEFGHGLATRAYGGEVHEMGVLLIAFQPIPYVDASSASAFPSKWQRIVVGAAGMMVELFIASCALFLWLNIEAGAIRTAAYNVLFLAGISTILFNANPLLRYDGYYMLSDYLEIPNLRARSHRYLVYLCERYVFGRQDAQAQTAELAERVWLTVYPIAAFLYRLFALAAITLFIAGKFFFVGVLLALAGIVLWILGPLVKALVYLCTDPGIRIVRRRALATSLLATVALSTAILWLPLPLRTGAEGVIWLPEQARLRAATDGFVKRIVARAGSPVRSGDILIECYDPQLTARVRVLQARLDELDTRYRALLLIDIRQAQIVRDEIVHVEQRLARATERVNDLLIRSRTDGIFEIPDAAKLPGRFINQGATLGYVLDTSALTARVVVPEADVELVRHQTKRIELRLIGRPHEIFTTTVQREVPAASEKLPTSALGNQGGGRMAVDPLDKDGLRTVEKTFQFDLALPASASIQSFGGRVHVRFDHGWEPIASRWHRQLRQLFLARFHV